MSSTIIWGGSGAPAGQALDAILSFCAGEGASDVTIQGGRPVFAEIDGQLVRVTENPVEDHQVRQILVDLYGPHAISLLTGNDLDFSWEIPVSRVKRLRFRVNATGILGRGMDTFQLTFRVLPDRIPTLEEMDVGAQIIEACRVRQGLVLVTGPTGSGKTTLLAGLIRHLAESGTSGKILTYESPIEYVHDTENGLVSQTEIPRHLPDYARAIRNALRRKPGIIVAGEARDQETISGMMEAALTGHLVMGTTHTSGVPETIPRLLSVFPESSKARHGMDLLESLRLVVSQVLVPRINGGRVAVREWLVFDGNLRRELMTMNPTHISGFLSECLVMRGSSFLHGATSLYERGFVSEEVRDLFVNDGRSS